MGSIRSSGMLPSLAHRPRVDNSQKKVDELICKYRSAEGPSPVMLELINSPDSYSILINALRRQISLIKCRSHDFEDCQITVYDKALLILSNHGGRVTDPSVLEIYLTEFLGVVPIAPQTDGEVAIANHAELENVLERLVRATQEKKEVARPTKEDECDQIATPPYKSNDEYEPYFPEIRRAEKEESKTATDLDKQARPDVRVARLLEVYHQAKDDYFRIKAKDGVESLPAVRFLRDSAENALRYLHANGLSDHPWVRDLEENFAMARDRTTQLLGGRKRHFDDDHKRHHGEGYKGRRRGPKPKRARRVVDSYRPSRVQ